MKFYFCQGCGVRVTEDDIDQGLARNKRLKGVFCRDCAEGITTMESLPMSGEEARRVMRDEKAEGASSDAKQPTRRKTSASRIPAGKTRKPVSGQRPSGRHAAAGGTRAFRIIAVIAVVLALFILIAYIARKPTRDSQRASRSNSHGGSAAEGPHTANPNSAAQRSTTSDSAPVKEAPMPDDEAAPKKASKPASSPTAVEKTGPRQSPEKQDTQQTRAPLEAKGDDPPVLPKAPKKPDGPNEPDSEKPDTPAHEAAPLRETAPTGPPAHVLAFGKYLDEVLDAAERGDSRTLISVSTKMSNDATLAEWHAAGRLMPAVSKDMAEAMASREVARRELIGKVMRLQGVGRGKVLAVEKGRLKFQRLFEMNGELKVGKTQWVSIVQLPQTEEQRLLKIRRPKTPVGWAARAVQELAMGRLTRAEKALKECRASRSALTEPLERRWKLMKQAALERDAAKEWGILKKQLGVRKAKPQMSVLLDQLERWEKAYGRTAFADAHQAERSGVIRTLARAVRGVVGSLPNPKAFKPLGVLVLKKGEVTFDTTTLRMSGSIQGTGEAVLNESKHVELALFCFSHVEIGKAVKINVKGRRGLVLASQGDMLFQSALSVSARGGVGGPGAEGGERDTSIASAPPPQHGGRGGDGRRGNTPARTGTGKGGGDAACGGGSYGGKGGGGGKPYGDALLTDLFGGSGGGGGHVESNGARGGGGGGAVALIAAGKLILTGRIEACGSNTGSMRSASGAGSGGAVLLAARQLTVADAKILAKGGKADPGIAGGGGGGRVAFHQNELNGKAEVIIEGGHGKRPGKAGTFNARAGKYPF